MSYETWIAGSLFVLLYGTEMVCFATKLLCSPAEKVFLSKVCNDYPFLAALDLSGRDREKEK